MKRSLALALALSVAIAACHGKSQNDDDFTVTPTPTASATPTPDLPETVRSLSSIDGSAVANIDLVVNDSSGAVVGTSSTGATGEVALQIPPNGSVTALLDRSSTEFFRDVQVYRGVPAGATVTFLEAPAAMTFSTFTLNWPVNAGATSYTVYSECSATPALVPPVSVQLCGLPAMNIAIVALDAGGASVGALFQRDVPVSAGATVDLTASYSATPLSAGYTAPTSDPVVAVLFADWWVGRTRVPFVAFLSSPTGAQSASTNVPSSGESRFVRSASLVTSSVAGHVSQIGGTQGAAGPAVPGAYVFTPALPAITLSSADVMTATDPVFSWSGAPGFGEQVIFSAQFFEGGVATNWTVRGPEDLAPPLHLPALPSGFAAFEPSASNTLTGYSVQKDDLGSVTTFAERLAAPLATTSSSFTLQFTSDSRS